MSNWKRLYHRDLTALVPTTRGVIAKSDYRLEYAQPWWCRKPGAPYGAFKETFPDAVEYVFGGCGEALS